MTKLSRVRASLLAAALAAVAVAPAQANKKPRNPHWKNRNAAAARPALPVSTQAAVDVSTAPAGPPVARLPAGRWLPEIKKSLEEFIAAHGRSAPGYDPKVPPAAVLAFNEVAVSNDVGLAVFQRMVDRADFKFNDAFWHEIPLVHGRQRLFAAYGIFIEQPVDTWSRQPSYQQYRKGFFKAYRDMCEKLGRLECRSWLVKLLRGYGEEELASYTRAAIGAEYLRPSGTELVAESSEDPDPVAVRHGLAWVPEIHALISLLRDSGFDVYAADADEQHEFEVLAAQADFEASRVQGIRSRVVAEKLTSEIIPPVPLRGGKANAAAALIGRPPALVVGAGLDDKELLEYSAKGGLRLLLDRGDPGMMELAAEKHWLVQPAFQAPPRRP